MTNLISSFSEEIAKLYREMLRGVTPDGVASTNFTSYITHPNDTDSFKVDKRKYIQISKKQFDRNTSSSGYNGPMIRIHFEDGEMTNLGTGSEQVWRVNGATWEIVFDTTQIKSEEEEWQRKWQSEILKTITYNMPTMKDLIHFIDVNYATDNLNDTDEFKKRINVIHDLIVENG